MGLIVIAWGNFGSLGVLLILGVCLRQFFTDAELKSFSSEIDGSKASELDYYPLLKLGDRTWRVGDCATYTQVQPLHKPDLKQWACIIRNRTTAEKDFKTNNLAAGG